MNEMTKSNSEHGGTTLMSEPDTQVSVRDLIAAVARSGFGAAVKGEH